MAGIRPKNDAALNSMPVYGHWLTGALRDLLKRVQNVSQQTNASMTAQQASPPPQINNLTVTAGGGVAHVQITDNNAIYRDIHYWVQYAADPGFASPITVHMGPSRDIRIPVGTQPLYYRAYSDYSTSAHSQPVYHGGSQPIAVTAIGANQPPIPAGQGSGTGFAGQISGHGPIPFRGSTPPKRS